MLEYFTYKKVKKHQADKEHSRRPETRVQERPVISEEDEHFLARIISAEGTPPALPERPHGLGPLAGDETGNRSQVTVFDGREAGGDVPHHKKRGDGVKEEKKGNRISGLYRSLTKKVCYYIVPTL